MSRAIWACALAAAAGALFGCGVQPTDGPAASIEDPPAEGPAWFVEEAESRGLDFVHVSGATGRYFLPEIMAGGAALFDMDDDGDLDAYLVQSGSLPATGDGSANRLYHNRGDGTFEDATRDSGADDRGYGTGCTTGDYDNDGDLDLYVTNVGRNTLLANGGGGRFVDLTETAGVGDPGWGASAAFFDFDGDGDLDLFVGNYLGWSVETKVDCHGPFEGLEYCSPNSIDRPAVDVLYRNDGDGTFSNVTDAAGLGRTRGNGLGVVCGDFDGDGRQDLFVANDGMDDRLWLNRGDGRFEDVALLAGCAIDEDGVAKAGMGVAAADVDDDGRLDLMVVNLRGETDSVFINRGGYFDDVTARAGIAAVSRPFTRFGVGWLDFDNDGWLDLYQANGRVKREAQLYSSDPYAEPNVLFRGGPDGRFAEVLPRGGTAPQLVAASRAAAFGDVDGDGGVDILVANKDHAPYLLMNRVPERGHWILLRIVDDNGRDAIGATVTLRIGDRTLTRDVRTAYSYLAANDPRVHVGLGRDDLAREVTVRWVDGTREAFGDLDADRVVVLRRGSGSPGAG